LYSVLDCVLASFVKGTGFPNEVVATMFCTFKSDVTILDLQGFYTLFKWGGFIKLSSSHFKLHLVDKFKYLVSIIKIKLK
jgi:hypothetical protein